MGRGRSVVSRHHHAGHARLYPLRHKIPHHAEIPRHKLASDGTRYSPGQAIVTPSVIRGELLALYRELEYAGIVENFDAYKADLIVERNGSDRNRVDVLAPPDIVNQFRIFAMKTMFVL